MAEVAELKTTMPRTGSRRRRRPTTSSTSELAAIPNLPLAEVPDGADEHGNVEHHRFGAKRELRASRRSSISSSARRSA